MTPGRRLLYTVRSVWDGLDRDDVAFYAAGIAYHSLFSIFAALFLASLLLGTFGADPENLRKLAALAGGMVPDKATELVDTILDLVSRPVPSPLLPVALGMTLWTASNVVQALIHSLNRIYHLHENRRPPWRTRLLALAVVGLSIALLVFGFLLLVFERELGRETAPLGRLVPQLVAWAIAARRPLSILAVFGGASLLYWLAPNFKQAHRVSWPGALVFTGAWTLATVGFNLYLRHLAVYDRVYGPLATVVVVLIWVYLSAFLCLVGGEVNAALGKLRRERAREAALTPADS
jgi:membrane protein